MKDRQGEIITLTHAYVVIYTHEVHGGRLRTPT